MKPTKNTTSNSDPLSFDDDIYPLLYETVNNLADGILLLYALKMSYPFEVARNELPDELLRLILGACASMIHKSFVRRVPLMLCSLNSIEGIIHIQPVFPNGVPNYSQGELTRIKLNLEANEYNQIH